jgi:N-formylglutamate amidohydrolase
VNAPRPALAASGAAFEILAPAGDAAPIVAHVPHASAVVPDDVRSELLIGPLELADELLRLTDWYTDELFAGLRELGATMFVNRRSRLVFDPERFTDDTIEPTAPRGQGVVYWQGSRQQLIRQGDSALRARRVHELYLPYHAALGALVGTQLDRFGECLVLDCHSFPSMPLPSELDHSSERPDICIGSDQTHTPSELAEAMAVAFAAEGWSVGRNAPFAGTFVPSGYYGREARVRSVMIEVRRGLYMDEADGHRLPVFATVASAIKRAVGKVVG